MHSIHRRGRSAGRITSGAAAVLAATVGTIILALGVGVPAGATQPWGPHDPGQIHAAPPPESASARAHALTPLTLANIVVTPLGSPSSSFYTFSDPALGSGTGCSNTPSASICLTFGTGQPGGGQFSMNVPSFSPGHIYTEQDGTISVSSGTVGCSATATNDSVGQVEVDQYLSTSPTGPVAAVQFDCTSPTIDITGTIALNIVPTDPNNGYYLFGQQGEITGFGNDNYLTYLDGAQYYNLNSPIVGMAPTPNGTGYWMVGSDGGVFSSGTAGFYGSAGSLKLNAPIVGMAATPDGGGYWFVASDGGVFNYGDAGFYGSMGGQPLNKPIVGMAATPSEATSQ